MNIQAEADIWEGAAKFCMRLPPIARSEYVTLASWKNADRHFPTRLAFTLPHVFLAFLQFAMTRACRPGEELLVSLYLNRINDCFLSLRNSITPDQTTVGDVVTWEPERNVLHDYTTFNYHLEAVKGAVPILPEMYPSVSMDIAFGISSGMTFGKLDRYLKLFRVFSINETLDKAAASLRGKPSEKRADGDASFLQLLVLPALVDVAVRLVPTTDMVEDFLQSCGKELLSLLVAGFDQCATAWALRNFSTPAGN